MVKYICTKRGAYMLIINKKRIIIILCMVGVSLYAYSLKNTYNVIGDNKANKFTDQTVQTVSTPVSNKVVIIDAGHGLPDGGAVGNSGTIESEINLKIALKLQKLLEESGSYVILTRSDENGIYENDNSSISDKKVSDIKNRVTIGNESSADIFVSIHLNKIEEEQYHGWQTFYNSKSEEGKRLSECIQNSLNETISKDNRRVPKEIDNVYILNHVEIPISIVECGFLSNNEEEQNLKSEEYQNKLAYGIYIGIIDYFYNK